METPRPSQSEVENRKEDLPNPAGRLVVVTGISGVGKDKIFQGLLDHSTIKSNEYSRVVTCATRDPRPDETPGVHYHFVKEEDLFTLHAANELVEDPVKYGDSYKATPKQELMQVLEDKNKIWRIEINLAGKVASGEFFEEMGFKKKVMMERTIVLLVNADQETIENRRKSRDGENYNVEEYQKRDEYDAEILTQYGEHFTKVIDNPDGENDSIEKIIGLINEYFEE